MIDKTVDAEWKKQGSLQRSLSTRGTPPLPVTLKTPERIRARILVMLTAFFMTLFTLLRTVASHVTGKLPHKFPSNDQNTSEAYRKLFRRKLFGKYISGGYIYRRKFSGGYLSRRKFSGGYISDSVKFNNPRIFIISGRSSETPKDNSLELLSSGTKDIKLTSISEGFEEFLKAYFKVSVASPE